PVRWGRRSTPGLPPTGVLSVQTSQGHPRAIGNAPGPVRAFTRPEQHGGRSARPFSRAGVSIRRSGGSLGRLPGVAAAGRVGESTPAPRCPRAAVATGQRTDRARDTGDRSPRFRAINISTTVAPAVASNRRSGTHLHGAADRLIADDAGAARRPR